MMQATFSVMMCGGIIYFLNPDKEHRYPAESKS